MNDEKRKEDASSPEQVSAPRMPELLTVSPSPHIRQEDTTRSIMLDVLIALSPALAWAIFLFGVRALLLTVIAVASSVAFEALFNLAVRKKCPIGDLSACVTGVLIAFNLPVSAPWWLPVVGSAFAMVIVKGLFGGIGKNIVNPALAARVFLFLSWSRLMTDFSGVDAVASATPLKQLKAGELAETDLIDLFIGSHGGCIGEVSSLLLIAGGLYLLFRRVISWQIPVAYLGTVALLTFLFPQNPDTLRFMLGELFSGGLMLGAFFMATDYATSPMTARARLVYGVGCGLITVFIRYFGGYPEGVSFSILIMNLLAWPLDRLLRPRPFGGGKKHAKK